MSIQELGQKLVQELHRRRWVVTDLRAFRERGLSRIQFVFTCPCGRQITEAYQWMGEYDPPLAEIVHKFDAELQKHVTEEFGA